MKDKISKGEGSSSELLFVSDRNALMDEAAAALQMLGFAKTNVNKVLQQLISSNPNLKVEDLIKKALQML